VLLHVKAMEVSRTKLRALGFDWVAMSNGDLFVQGVSGLIGGVAKGASDGMAGVSASPSATMQFDIVNGNSAFFGVLEALRQDNLAKILAEPTLVTTSGRPAYFQVGGEVPYLVPQGLGTTAIEYKEWGTRVDFVPIVLGGGRIRLEVRPRVSDIDTSRSVVKEGEVIYAFTKHEVDTGVQMQAGQTLAIAGLVQNRVESHRRGVPWVSELPYVGAAFRRVEERNNEVELLIFVTPELVDAMDAHEVPPCGPGMRTTSPDDCELYFKGHIEVPKCCPPGTAGTHQGQAIEIMTTGQEQPPLPGQILAPSPTVPIPPAPMPPSVSSTRQNRSVQQSRSAKTARKPAKGELPGFIGPIGYAAAE
jgi:pilus assembly protein CpaC